MAEYSRTTQEDLEFALGNICDVMSALDMAEKVKGKGGLSVTSFVCDASGNTLFSYETVMKYYQDEYGAEHMTAEIAGKIVGNSGDRILIK
ncbi:hypothetical protein [Sulfurimonas sp. HSL3-2]|uniref:hypothetical protein n=1 Tax=Hydrocurvibacter mobilis TaxID=3131936 RepID=UPI0031F93997